MSRVVGKPVLELAAEFLVITAPKVAAVFFAKADTPPLGHGLGRVLLILAHGVGDEPPVSLSLKYGRRKEASPGVYRICFFVRETGKATRWTCADLDPAYGVQEFASRSARSIARELKNDLNLVAGLECSLESAPWLSHDVSFLYEPGLRRTLEGFPDGVILVGGTVTSAKRARS